jgi:hypothetical protein
MVSPSLNSFSVNRSERPQNRLSFASMRFYEKCGPNVRLQGLFLTANLATRLAVSARGGRDASDADESVARAQERCNLGPLDLTSIDVSAAPNETLARAQAALTV